MPSCLCYFVVKKAIKIVVSLTDLKVPKNDHKMLENIPCLTEISLQIVLKQQGVNELCLFLVVVHHEYERF